MAEGLRAQFLSRLQVEQQEDGCTWAVLGPLRYVSPIHGSLITVPAGFVTDFASVPRLPFAYWLAGNTAHAPAVVHDYLYQTQITKDRGLADAIFLEAMAVEGDPWWRRRLMWSAVRAVGQAPWRTGPTRYRILGNDTSKAASD